MKDFWKKTLINGALQIVFKFLVVRIPFEPLQTFTQNRFTLLKEIAEAITDSDPNDAEQLRKIWEDHDEQTMDDALETAAKIIERKVENIAMRNILTKVIRAVAAENILDADGVVSEVINERVLQMEEEEEGTETTTV